MSSVMMLCELRWKVVMMCLMRDENERERKVIAMRDDVDEVNNTCVIVLLLGNMIDVIMWCE